MSKKLSLLTAIILSLSVANSLSEVLIADDQQHQNDGGDDDDTNYILSTKNEEEERPSSIVDTAAADTENDGLQTRSQHHEEDVEETTILTTTATSSSSSPPITSHHEPPSHFQISAHIQTNLHTGLSYFLPQSTLQETSFAHIPFLECGAIGSTTATVPLVSGVFRHVPVMSGGVDEEEKLKRGGLEFLEGVSGEEEQLIADGDDKMQDAFFDDGEDAATSNGKEKDTNGPKRPSPPTYVVALSPLQITVGGNGNETQQFEAGDVIFFEDTWLGIWDDTTVDSEDFDENKDLNGEEKVKGYTMRASPESRKDMNVIMLTIPPALHRQWKHRHQRQRQQQQQQKQEAEMVHDKVSNKIHKKAPWWKLSSRIIKKQHIDELIPKPCSLESDPAFAHPSVSVPTTLSHHFSQHFTNLLRQFHQPFHLSLSSSSSHADYDLILPIFAQTAAATVGGATAFAGVLHLLRTVNPTVAIGFGAACVIGFGTWAIVWLGEELLDEWEMWRERRRLERRMSESWGMSAE